MTPYITTQLTNNDDPWGASAVGISGNYLFWLGSPVGPETSPWELYLSNGNTTIKIPNSASATNPGQIRILDNKLAWVGHDGTDQEIYFYDGNTTKKLTDNEIDASEVQLSANKVVWTENDGTDLEIYFYDGQFVQQLTNDNFPDYEIQVSGNRIIWIKQYPDNDPAPGDQADIFLYDGTNTINLSANLGQTSATPKFLNDGRIFWTEGYYTYYGPGDTERRFEYYIYDGNTISQLSLENAIGYEQVDTLYGVGVVGSIGNDLVFYDSNRVDGNPNTRSHAFIYDPDINTITRISDQPDVTSIQVSGNNLLIDRISGLYLYKEGSLTELTTSPGRLSSAISGDRVVWGSYNTDHTITDVFLATPATATAPTISINDASIVELDNGSNNLTFSVTLSRTVQQTVKVNYTTANNTATEGSDFTQTSGLITFDPGETTKTFTVPVRGDLIIEDHESFFVNLNSPINAVLAKQQGVGYIFNNDATSINLSIADLSIAESTSNAVLNVVLNSATNQAVTVNYATADSSAIANNDYTPKAGTLTFNPGEVVKTITIPILEDTNSEGVETFSLNFGDAVNATITDSQGIVTILDNDDPPLVAPIYRFYNPVSQGHFFTANTGERDTVLGHPDWGYQFEGAGFTASANPGGTLNPVYRFYNPVSQGHFFTINSGERDTVLANPDWGYQYEGAGFYAYGATDERASDVYRFYNPVSRGHFFTGNVAERDTVLANPSWGYQYEGVGFEAII